MSKQASSPFLKKRTKKLLLPRICSSRVHPDKHARRQSAEGQKFFGSFFQKRTASLPSFNRKLAGKWSKVGTGFLPFADAATADMPLSRLLRLSLFQVTVGMAAVLLIGTLNRVMIVELGVPTWLVAMMVSLPLIAAPFRAVVGFRSDNHRSVLGWKRVPYLWLGTMLQFGGFAIMPFALIILSGDSNGPIIVGQAAASLAFLLVGAGLHTVQTVGLALATDLTPPEKHPKVVALLCMMLLLGMVVSAVSVRRGAGAFLGNPANPVHTGCRRHHRGAERLSRCGSRSRGARPRPGRTVRAPASRNPGPSLTAPVTRAAAWWRWGSAPWRSACRTCCWSRTAARFCI